MSGFYAGANGPGRFFFELQHPACGPILRRMQTTVPAGIKFDAVSAFFAEEVPGGRAPLTFSLISGGRSNLTYKVESENGTWVLRRPPLGHVLPTAHDMAREFKVIADRKSTRLNSSH